MANSTTTSQDQSAKTKRHAPLPSNIGLLLLLMSGNRHSKSKSAKHLEQFTGAQLMTDMHTKFPSPAGLSEDGNSNDSVCGSCPSSGTTKRRIPRNKSQVQLHKWAAETERANMTIAEILERKKHDYKTREKRQSTA